MSVQARVGLFGAYWGNDFNSSNALSYEQMKMNSAYIYGYLNAQGWSLNAIAALLGNMQAESSINPGRWQSDDVGNYSLGYGLVQWTPVSKYTDWCTSKGYSDPSEMDVNLGRILYEVDSNIQWIATSSYPMSFKEFTTSSLSASELAKAFLLNYERPADQSESVQNYRGDLANGWFTYLGGVLPNDPTYSKRKKKKFNFILFNRRRNYGQRFIPRKN